MAYSSWEEYEAATDWLLKQRLQHGFNIMQWIKGDTENCINLPAKTIAHYIAEYHAEKSKSKGA